MLHCVTTPKCCQSQPEVRSLKYACLQVPLLLSLGEMESALSKAIDSGDTDLVYLALFRYGPMHTVPAPETLYAHNQASSFF